MMFFIETGNQMSPKYYHVSTAILRASESHRILYKVLRHRLNAHDEQRPSLFESIIRRVARKQLRSH